MKFQGIDAIKSACGGILQIGDDSVKVQDEEELRDGAIDKLVYNAVFGDSAEIRGWCRWLIKSASIDLGCAPSSIQGLYEKVGRGEAGGFTVPAINIRGLTYDIARAILRSSEKINMQAVLFEIAKSEIGYTFQHPSEYAAVILAAAIKEGYKGPVFIQGDHYQVTAKNYHADKEKEISGLKKLIADSIAAGFYNIDIDSSTMVELDKGSVKEEQRLNFELAAELTAYIRELEPEGITVSVGGEIGEVGGKNSTVEEFTVYTENYLEVLKSKGDMKGISKISVQTGTSHGGVPLPDGSVAKVALDFQVLEDISKAAVKNYGIAGAVQHGASTLPDEAFDKFPATGTVEVHLATGYQNMVYDSKHLPSDLRDKSYNWLRENCKGEWKEGQTEEQFLYKTRKKGFGPFKEEFWTLPESVRSGIAGELESKFDLLFDKLNCKDTKEQVASTVQVPAGLKFSLEKEISMAE